MGAFHYKLEVVPKRFVGDPPLANVPLSEIQEGLNPWAEPPPPSNHFITELRSLLPVDRSRGETEEYVSLNEYSSDLRIWRDQGKVENIEFRYNPYADNWSLMQNFIAIVKAETCMLVETRSGAVLPPDEVVLKARICDSNA